MGAPGSQEDFQIEDEAGPTDHNLAPAAGRGRGTTGATAGTELGGRDAEVADHVAWRWAKNIWPPEIGAKNWDLTSKNWDSLLIYGHYGLGKFVYNWDNCWIDGGYIMIY